MNEIIEEPNGKDEKRKSEILAALNGLVEVQSKDTEVRRLELDVRSQEIASNERIAVKSIEAQERSFLDGRDKYNRHLKINTFISQQWQ